MENIFVFLNWLEFVDKVLIAFTNWYSKNFWNSSKAGPPIDEPDWKLNFCYWFPIKHRGVPGMFVLNKEGIKTGLLMVPVIECWVVFLFILFCQGILGGSLVLQVISKEE